MMKEMTVKRKLKRPEILAPAGTLEKLKTAIHYGADAVYIGGNAYGLRSRAGNFTYEEMAEGVAFAKEHDAKVYVAANMVTHEGNEEGAGEFLAGFDPQFGLYFITVINHFRDSIDFSRNCPNFQIRYFL